MFKNVFGPLAASSQVYTFRAIQYKWVKNDFFTIKGSAFLIPIMRGFEKKILGPL
jgi:hypothetical protein